MRDVICCRSILRYLIAIMILSEYNRVNNEETFLNNLKGKNPRVNEDCVKA